MYRIFIISGLTLIGFCGCDSTQTTQTSGDSGGPARQSDSQTQPVIIGDVTLTPSRPIPILQLLIPKHFVQMEQSDIAIKYPNPNPPDLVYTNDTGAINIAINHPKDRVPSDDLKRLHQELDKVIRQTQPDATWMFSGFQHYHGRQWIQLEFQTDAIDDKIHNMVMVTVVQGRALFISFNCTDAFAGQWLIIGREIIKSAIVTE